MTSRTTGTRRSALILLIGTVAVAGSVATAIAAAPGGTPGAPAAPSTPATPSTPRPTTAPSAAPVVTAPPSVEPSRAPVDAIPLTVDLETLTPHHVYVDIVDESARLVSAVTGTPTANASVEPYTLRVENIDARTLRLTWVDRPGDNALALFIDPSARRFLLVQPEHDTDGDAIVHDRILVLTFREPISAGDVEAFLQDGLDTPA